VIARVGIQKGEDLATRGGVDYLVYAWQRKVILWTRFVEASIINAHSLLPGLLFNKNGIGKPVRVEYLSDEPGCQELSDLLAYGLVSLVVEAMQALFGGLRARDEAQSMLGDLPWYARHVRRLPCKDIMIGA